MGSSPRPTALITGASAGLGAEFARQLAPKGYDLALTARRGDRLELLANELSQHHGIQIQIRPADLSIEEGVKSIEDWIQDFSSLEILINNAGYGTRSRFSADPVEKQMDMIHVHVLATVRLTRAALPGMLARQRGAIINVSSMAALFPIRNVMYSSTKAFLVNFSKSLQSELWGSGIKIQALMPGYIHTEFHDTQELSSFKKKSIPGLLWLNAKDVVARSLGDLKNNEVECIPGWQYQAAAFFVRTPLTTAIALGIVRHLYSRRSK
jgi:uncharacterized protein